MSDTNEILKKVQEAFKESFNIDIESVTIETSPGNIPAWDSVGHLTLVSSLEQAFNISFDVDEMMEMENVREIVRVIQKKLAGKAS